MKEFYTNVCKGMSITILPVAIVLTIIAGLSNESFEVYYGCASIAIVLLLIQFGCNVVYRIKCSKWCVFFCLMAISINVVQMNHVVPEKIVYKQNSKDSTKTIMLKNYMNYYDATETLLDSLGVDADNPILETDEGSKYLKCVDKVNYIIDSNK